MIAFIQDLWETVAASPTAIAAGTSVAIFIVWKLGFEPRKEEDR